MRQIAILGTSVCALLCCNCVCADFGLIWTVEGEFVQAGTESPLAGEIVNYRLFRDGETINEAHPSDPAIPLEPDGGFQLDADLGLSGSCGVISFLPPPDRPLGDPPDEIEIVLQITDGKEVIIVVPILEENIGEITEYKGVELSGIISLGQILVPDEG